MSYYREDDAFHSEHEAHDGFSKGCEGCQKEWESLMADLAEQKQVQSEERLDRIIALFMIEPMKEWERDGARKGMAHVT